MSDEEQGMTVTELAALAGAHVVAGGDVHVSRVSPLEAAERGSLCFVEAEKFLGRALDCRASCLIVPEGAGTRARELAAQIPAIVEAARPKLAFALAAEVLHAPESLPACAHATAVVAEDAELGAGVYVGPHAVVGSRARVGANSRIHAGARIGDDVTVGGGCVLRENVVLYGGVSLGERVVLHAGVVVGADGFGYVRDAAGVYHKFPQVGTAVIEDDVEIGAGSCVDRGALGETRIGRGTKIDNLVQIGHNVRIGERVVIAAQTGISGSTVIEDDAVIGGQVGFGDHARVERGAVIGSKAGVLPGKIVRAGTVQWGVPVRPLDEYKRLNAHFGRLPQMRADLDELKRRVRELFARVGGQDADRPGAGATRAEPSGGDGEDQRLKG